MWLRNNVPDTNRAPYDPAIRTPDYLNYDKYKNSGFMGIYYVITQAILELKKTVASLDVAYMPLKTPSYEDINPLAT